jgi:hypothetical protein
VSLLPPAVIGSAIAAGLAIPLLLVMLSFGPRRLRPAGPRYKISVLVAWALWVVVVAASGAAATATLLDWLAGAAVLVAATLATFNAWSLPAYGVTLNMLVVLSRAERPLDLEAWADRYSGGRSLEQILRDRLGHLLFFRLARRDGDVVRLLPGPSRLAVALLRTWYFIFGLPHPK